MKNNRFHRGIGMTPFEAQYGRKIGSLPTAQNIEPEITEPIEPAFELSDKELSDVEDREILDLSHSTMQHNLEAARQKQQKQAADMLKSTAMRYGEVEPGTAVRIPVPEVDRAKADPRNVLAVVMENNNGNFLIKITKKN
jgi:hypothetical protein